MKILLIIFQALVVSTLPVLALTFPYEAPAERQKLIRTHLAEFKPGMSSKDVRAILNDPDKTTPLYEPRLKKPREIGTTMWYIVSQQKEHGSQNEVQRVALGIRLDLNGKVLQVDRFNM